MRCCEARAFRPRSPMGSPRNRLTSGRHSMCQQRAAAFSLTLNKREGNSNASSNTGRNELVYHVRLYP